MGDVWDCIVVGAGVVGCCTAYHLTRAHKKVLVLEQFALPHTRGSSHGQSRIIRKSYDDPRMMDHAYKWWKHLEQQSGKTLFRKTGILNVGGIDHRGVKQHKELVARNGISCEFLSNAELHNRFPMLRYPSDYIGILDNFGGVLFNDRCLSVLRDLIVKNGGTILDGVKVEQIWPGSEVTVVTGEGHYRARKVVLTPGPWANDLLTKIGLDLRLKTMPGTVLYWKSSTPHLHTADVFPFFMHHLPDVDRMIYAMPALEYPSLVKFPCLINVLEMDTRAGFVALFPPMEYPGLVKVVTRGEPPDRYCHPDERDAHHNQHMIGIVSEYIRKHLPGISDSPSIIEPCMYTMTPDKTFIIDHHPLHTNIMFAVGMSGHGFMVAPVTGEILSDMVLEQKPKFDIAPFSMARFNKPAAKL